MHLFKGNRSLIEDLCREMLAHPIVSEVLVSPRIDLLQKASQDDAEFIATTLQVIQAISQSIALGTSPGVGFHAMFVRLAM